jgi:hypothetical protein
VSILPTQRSGTASTGSGGEVTERGSFLARSRCHAVRAIDVWLVLVLSRRPKCAINCVEGTSSSSDLAIFLPSSGDRGRAWNDFSINAHGSWKTLSNGDMFEQSPLFERRLMVGEILLMVVTVDAFRSTIRTMGADFTPQETINVC